MARQPANVANPRVVRLLKEDLPKMQPSALKHTYLTSVANALRNPVEQEQLSDGTRRIIAFGDVHRRLPLLLVQEAEGDDTIRHAFVPSPSNPDDRYLLDKLQEHEVQWATERGVRPRNIAAQIRNDTRSEINRHGLDGYVDAETNQPRSPFTKADTEIIMAGGWYQTRFIEPSHEIDHDGRPRMDEHRDRRKLERNVSTSANFVNRTPTFGPRSLQVELDRLGSKGELRFKSLHVDPDLPEIDEPEY